MHRSWLVVLSLLIVSTLGFGQSASNDSQGMQALVAEVRQLRKDLQASNGNALKAQVLLFRLQVQETTVARVSQQLNEARGKLADTQRHRTEISERLKRLQDALDNTEISPADRKQIQYEVSASKAELENLATEEQQRQTAELQAEEQLRTEQAKLNELEDRVDRLEKDLTSNPK